jgi:hypothetical protein
MAGMVVRTAPSSRGIAGWRPTIWRDRYLLVPPVQQRLVVAWEIDGQDPPDVHILGGGPKDLAGNKAKLDACKANIKVQVLYSLKNDISPKSRSKRQQIGGWLPGIEVVTDEELMAPVPRGIDSWMHRASGAIP